MKPDAINTNILTMRHSLGVAVCAGAVLLLTAGAQGQNLFVADFGSDNIYEFTPGGTRSTFASGLNGPFGLALQSVTLPIPEPSALGLLAVGIGGLSVPLVVRRRKAWGRMTLLPGFKFGSFVMLFRTTPNQRLIDKRLSKPVAMRLPP